MEQITMKINEILGQRYRILDLVGQGGMSNVYLAEDLKLKGKKWAIKQSCYQDHDVLVFIEEAEILIKLCHPNLPTIVDYFPPANGHGSFLVMDYIKGQTLLDIYHKNSTILSWQQVVKYAIQLCDLFNYLHHIEPDPIIYRDLKPANVMIDEQDNVRLIDFGIARNYKAHHTADTVEIGTVGFASPEQFKHKQTDQRTDLYTLGAMMYFLLSGGNYYSLVQNPLELLNKNIPPKLVQIIHKLLNYLPEDRYHSAILVKNELEHVENKHHNTTGIDSSSADYINIQTGTLNKLIVIGSLFPCAGSTFLTLTTAKALNYYGISHAVVEFPENIPELYFLLYGERNAPANYRFFPELTTMGSANPSKSQWREGQTIWYPLDPNSLDSEWSSEQFLKLLYSLKNSVVLLDVSTHWDSPNVKQILEMADEIVVVADPSVAKINRPQSLKVWDLLNKTTKKEGNISVIANRDPGMKLSDEWIRLLPIHPIVKLPNFPYIEIIKSLWEGKLIQEKPEVLGVILTTIRPLLEKIVLHNLLDLRTKDHRKGIFRKLFKKIN